MSVQVELLEYAEEEVNSGCAFQLSPHIRVASLKGWRCRAGSMVEWQQGHLYGALQR